jgi:hypothetical protein
LAGAFLKQILTDKDEAFVIDFNVDSSLAAGLYPRRTPAAESAELGEDQFRLFYHVRLFLAPEVVRCRRRSSPARCCTTQFILSAHDMLAKEVGRKAMILLTDGRG